MKIASNLRTIADFLESIEIELSLKGCQLVVSVVFRENKITKFIVIIDFKTFPIVNPAYYIRIFGVKDGV